MDRTLPRTVPKVVYQTKISSLKCITHDMPLYETWVGKIKLETYCLRCRNENFKETLE